MKLNRLMNKFIQDKIYAFILSYTRNGGGSYGTGHKTV